jgi:sugar (pentulose or hexulose) kinase
MRTTSLEKVTDMSGYILGIDIGTTALKAAVLDYQGELKATATIEYSLLTPKVNFVEEPSEIYIQSIIKSLEAIRKNDKVDTRDIKVIGFSAQGETLIFLDKDGKSLRNAIVWMDNRAVDQAEKMKKHFGNEKCYQITGQVSFEPCWPAPKILWVKDNEPEIFKKTKHFLLVEDYIIYLMTGKFVAEGSLLTSTLYWDITTKKYWPEMLEFIGMNSECLPEIMESGQLVGTITPEMAETLKVSPDAKVCTGCLDQVAGAIGVGNIHPGIFSENIGAALAICAPTQTLTYDPNRLMPVHYFAVPDSYMMHTFTTGGMTLKWFRDAFAQMEIDVENTSGIDAYFLLDKIAEKAPPGSDGLLTLPHLCGSNAPDVNSNAKGVFFGFTLKHKRAHFIRSIMESLGYIICRNIEALENMGLRVDQIRCLGGGSKSDLWNQIKSDITGKKLLVFESSQVVACLGAAILAGVATGIFTNLDEACNSMIKVKNIYEPNKDLHEIYKKQYASYKKLFQDMSSMFEHAAQ